MKLTQEFKNDFKSFLIKLFIIVWCSSLSISIGGLFLQLQSDLNFYKLFAMLIIGFAIIIVFALVISLIASFILGSIDSFKQFKKYAFHKGKQWQNLKFI